jgi:hypothetical protein
MAQHLCLTIDARLECFPDTITTHTLDLNVPKNLDQHLLHAQHTPLSPLRVGVISFSQCAIPFQVVPIPHMISKKQVDG